MINPIRGNGWNPEPKSDVKNINKKRQKISTKKGVILEIQTVQAESISATEKVEKLKKLIREGKYPLDPQKVADKLLDFLTDVG